MTTVADKLPPTLDERCGTYAGHRAHFKRKENSCTPCTEVSKIASAKRANLRKLRRREHGQEIKFQRKYTPANKRWGEVVITQSVPAHPELETPARVSVKTKKPKRKSADPFVGVSSWDNLSKDIKASLLRKAERDLHKE